MPRFEVIITAERGSVINQQVYTIWEHHHDDKSALAAERRALRTFREHGHAKFPYEDGPLVIKVRELEEEGIGAN